MQKSPENPSAVYAPIVLFVYKRLDHVRKTLAALKNNDLAPESDLVVYSDGAKDAGAAEGVRGVRQFLKTIDGFKSVTIIERGENLGLARSVIDGVTTVCSQYGRVIVMEDDLVTSPHFLRYMNDGLNEYAEDDRVVSIHGYVYPVKEPLPSTFFLRGADCWGWATWKRGWDLFDSDACTLLIRMQKSGETDAFNFNGQSDYIGMLRHQVEGRINSWAICWYASTFLANKLTLYPGVSLVRNIGNDDSGTHGRRTHAFDGALAQQPLTVVAIPVRISDVGYAAVSRYFKSQKPSLLRRLLDKLVRSMRQRVAA